MENRKIHALFGEAYKNGLTNLILRIGSYRIKLAPASGKNKGMLYVTRGQEYLGKIDQSNHFFALTNVDKQTIYEVEEIIQSPMQQAIMSGHRTGHCAICGRRLDNENSIALGIGPICAERVGAFLPQDVLDSIKAHMPPKKYLPNMEVPDDF
jgi:hypothetical protein